MTRTFCTVIRDTDAEAVLGPWACHMAAVRHWAFKERYVRGRPLKDVKREAIARFDISARQFNGVRFDLDQAVNAWRGQIDHRVKDLADQVKHAGTAVRRLERKLTAERRKNDPSRRKIRSIKFRLHQKKRLHAKLQARLDAARAEARRSVPNVCFGGRGPMRRGQIGEWRERRTRMLTLVGSKDEAAGNQTARWDGETLTVRLPDALGGGFKTLHGVRFRYGQAEMLGALERGAGITWRFYRRGDGAWQANATIEEPAPAVTATTRSGTIGVDLNVDHLAVTVADRYGNAVDRWSEPFPTAGTDTHRAEAMIGDAVKRIVDTAHDRGMAVACEDLDFQRKKAGLRNVAKQHARRLSGFGYMQFHARLAARCGRRGVELHAVDPAYSSMIAEKRYARGLNLSRHHAAALVLARRAMGMGERLVCTRRGALVSAAQHEPRHVWRRWRDARPRRPRERNKPRTAASASGRTRTGAVRQNRACAADPSPAVSTRAGRTSAGAAVPPANPV
jgi:IS605 OrfB family transposase